MKDEYFRVKADLFAQVSHVLIDEFAARIGTTALAVYVGLQRFADFNDGKCFPKQSRLCSLLDISENTLRSAIKRLEEENLIIVKPEVGGQTTYWVLTPSKIAPPPSKIEHDDAQKLSTNNNKQLKRNKYPVLDAGLAREIYCQYPRLVALRKAVEAIQKAHSRLMEGENGNRLDYYTARDFLIMKVGSFARNCRVQGKEEKFIPHPATWFNQSRYLDGEEKVSKETSLFDAPSRETVAEVALSAVEKVRRQLGRSQ